jgi:hypothetical protein
MRKTLLVLMVALMPVPALAAPVIDNNRVTVWDVTLAKGQSAPATPADKDTIIMFLEGGGIQTAMAGGTTITASRKFGDAMLIPKGSTAVDTLVSGGPAHEIVVALKDHAGTAVANTSGLPLAFPRPGSVKVLENAKVIVWHYSWTKGKPTPMHFHDKDVVVAYRYDGTLKSTMPDGTIMENPYKKGDIRFNKGNRSHSELLTTARQSAVILELK